MTRYYFDLGNMYVRFNAPIAKYTNVLAELGVEGLAPTGKPRGKGPVSNYGIMRLRATLDVGSGNKPKSVILLCNPSKLSTALSALIGKSVNTLPIIEVNPVRHRILI